MTHLSEYQDEHDRSLSRLHERKNVETAPKAKHMHVKKEKFKSTANAFFYSLKKEIDNPDPTSKFEAKSHLCRPRQLEGNPGYEYQRYCELHSIAIQKQIALKKDSNEMQFINITMAGLPQATAVSHFLKVIRKCPTRFFIEYSLTPHYRIQVIFERSLYVLVLYEDWNSMCCPLLLEI